MTSSYEFYIKHMDRNGAVKHNAVTDFLRLRYRLELNDAGRMDVDLANDHRVMTDFEKFDQFEVYWRNQFLGVPWHRDFDGIGIRPEWETDPAGNTVAQLAIPGSMHMLNFRQVLFYSGVDDYSLFEDEYAETLIKRVVRFNCTANATVLNGRLRAGDLAPGMGWTVTVAPDQARGNVVSHSFGFGNVLQSLIRDIFPIAGGDVSFTKTGNAEWLFEFHEGQLGEDKSTGTDRVVFSQRRGDVYIVREGNFNALDERTVAIVAGQGVGAEREVEIVESDDYSIATDIEMYVDARNETIGACLDCTGTAALDPRRDVYNAEIDVIQTPSVFYSRQTVLGKSTYQVGDLILIRTVRGVELVRKIRAVEIIVTPARGDNPIYIKVELALP